MAAFNELSSAPDGAMHGIALADAHEEYSAISAAADDCSNGAVATAPCTRRRNGFQRMGRTLLKPLIAVVTAQYVIVTALAAFAALVVASEAGKSINAKLEPIIAALKRL